MNGQVLRQKLVRNIFKQIEFDIVVETGTFRGGTTRWLRDVSGLPVYSVESVDRFYRYAKEFCSYSQEIHLFKNDSRAFLGELAEEIKSKRVFFYLDAHWEDDVPRYEELLFIQSNSRSAVVVVDDFRVPGDGGYGFATYGKVPLDESYLPSLGDWRLFYPNIPSDLETGAKRGCAIFVSPDLVGPLAAINQVRAA